MKIYNIYHPLDGKLNTQCEHNKFTYEFIGTIEANSLPEVFKLAQNDFNGEYASLGRRSTSVGDVITDGETHYMIKGNGYASCNPNILQYTCPTINVFRLNALIQERLKNPEDYMLI